MFDVLIHRGRKVTGLALEDRRGLLTEAMQKIEYPVIQSTAFVAPPADLIKAAKELELEGVIAKRKGSLYEPGRRSGAWLKYKIKRSQEFVIGGYTVGIDPFDALIVGCYKGRALRWDTVIEPCVSGPRTSGTTPFLIIAVLILESVSWLPSLTCCH